MIVWSCAGDILRWWRQDVLRLSQQSVASRLSVQPTAFSNWENDARAISLDLDLIDRALEGGGLLEDLLRASRTPEGLPPSHLWSKVYTGPTEPIWMWIRSEHPSINIEVQSGATYVGGKLELGGNGAFVYLGLSGSDSSVIVKLSERGWVDFGRGELKNEIPEASTYSAESLASTVPTLHRTLPPASWPPLALDHEEPERWRFADLRQARGLSLVETADRLEAMTGVVVSKDTLRRYETGVGEPHNRFLSAALDHVLGADGHLGLLTIRRGQGDGALRFPPYWRAPIWIEFSGEASESPLRLGIGKWARVVNEAVPCLLVHHYCLPTAPLRIVAPGGVSWQVGIGRRRGGQAIDDNWIAADNS